jgi:hypothetical protein
MPSPEQVRDVLGFLLGQPMAPADPPPGFVGGIAPSPAFPCRCRDPRWWALAGPVARDLLEDIWLERVLEDW